MSHKSSEVFSSTERLFEYLYRSIFGNFVCVFGDTRAYHSPSGGECSVGIFLRHTS